jgi:hypothetical protein
MLGFGLLVMAVGFACGAPAGGGTPEEEAAGSETATAPGGSGGTPETTDATMLPVSINQGLASLDSYRLTYTNDVFDSVAEERNVTTLVVSSDRDSDSSYTRTETLVTTGDGEEVSEDVQEQYQIGNRLCTLTDGEVEFSSISEIARVMTGLLSQVVDFNPLIEDPVYVGQDVVNGVPVRTYTFEVRSLGAASGAEASRADGTYALAVDGDYIVQYRLDMELRTGPEGDPAAESSVSSFDLSLEEINQPVEIGFPAACLEAESLGE